MNPRMLEPEDHAIDAIVEAIARAEAPATLTARVSAALDAAARPAQPERRLGLIFGTAAAGLVVVTGLLWMAVAHRPLVSAPPMRSASARPTPPGISAPAIKIVPPGLGTSTGHVGDGASRPTRRARHADDHERALAALAPPAAAAPHQISPAAIDTISIDVGPMNSIVPLTLDSGRQTSGRGDFR